MCLAVPGKLVACDGVEAVVDLGGNRIEISRVLTPEACVGDWVLVHAGFSISTIDEDSAKETWSYLRACYDGETEAILGEAGSSGGGAP